VAGAVLAAWTDGAAATPDSVNVDTSKAFNVLCKTVDEVLLVYFVTPYYVPCAHLV
jgi:hypothetical protein